jgi:hypothetical protein
VQLGDVVGLVRDRGLEGALRALQQADVSVSLDEFKGRKPIERPGISLPASHTSFNNPLQGESYPALTGGSRGVRRRVSIDLDLIEHEAASTLLFEEAYGLRDRPYGLWRAIPPSGSGIGNSLRHVKTGRPVSAWYTPYRAPRDFEALKFAVFTSYTLRAVRRSGIRVPSPEHCLPEHAVRVAGWLADRKREGAPAFLDTQASLGVRTCRAAMAEGLDIAGTVFRLGGEPYTEEKARIFEAAGCRAVCHYTMAETGRIAVACGDQDRFDDMHFLADKLAVLQVDRVVDATGVTVGAFHYTSLLPSAPKVMINVESDDYGELVDRSCRCPFGELGLTLHMRGIRSYEKLTSEGNQFLGNDLLALVDRVLPARFGGGPGDYQLVEEEVDGLPKVSVVVRPTLGPLDEREVVSAVLGHLRAEPRNRLMADVWRDGDTVRVVRREPYVTGAGKILALHLVRDGSRARAVS